METGSRRRKSIPESIVVEVIARLPLKSIARFKSVSKRWRSLIESSYFRSLFHRNSSSSSSWSLMFPINHNSPITEAISFYGCERWDLPKSPASYIMPYQQLPNLGYYYYVSSSHGLVWIAQIYDDNGTRSAKSFLGNPVLQERIEVPPPPDPDTMPYSLVTRLVNGVVSSFKVVRTCYETIVPRDGTYVWWSMYVYSSETGRWAFKRLWSSCPLQRSDFSRPLNLNGTVYVWEKRLDDDDDTGPGVIVSYDFYAEEGDDQCRVIPLPVPYNKNVRRCLTTSGGDVIYVEILDRRLKVWKMRNNSSDGEWWQLTRKEIDMASLGFDVNCFPLGMNPFDADLVYLWSRQHGCVVSGNLKTLEFTLHQETETWSDSDGCWRINTSVSKKRMETIYDPASVITLSQFVLPQWMDPVPHPPN